MTDPDVGHPSHLRVLCGFNVAGWPTPSPVKAQSAEHLARIVPPFTLQWPGVAEENLWWGTGRWISLKPGWRTRAGRGLKYAADFRHLVNEDLRHTGGTAAHKTGCPTQSRTPTQDTGRKMTSSTSHSLPLREANLIPSS